MAKKVEAYAGDDGTMYPTEEMALAADIAYPVLKNHHATINPHTTASALGRAMHARAFEIRAALDAYDEWEKANLVDDNDIPF